MKENFDKENKKEPSGFSSGSGFGKLGFGQEKETFGGESDGFGEGFGREKKDGEEGFGKDFGNALQEDKKGFGKNFAEDAFGSSLQEEKKNFDSLLELSPDSDSFPEKKENEEGKAWYEDTGDSWYRQGTGEKDPLKGVGENWEEPKIEHRAHIMLEEHAKHAHTFPSKEEKNSQKEGKFSSKKESGTRKALNGQASGSGDGKAESGNASPSGAAKASPGRALPVEKIEKLASSDGKVYLPDPPPSFQSDRIPNPHQYIAENFKDNKAIGRIKKKGNPLFIAFGYIFAVLSFVFFAILQNAWMFIAFVLFSVLLFYIGSSKKNDYLNHASEFFLIKPYAIKKKVERTPAPCDSDNSFRSLPSEAYGLIFYYLVTPNSREAMTAAVYTEEQIDILASAFLRGELVVACRFAVKEGERDTAVVCCPDPL